MQQEPNDAEVVQMVLRGRPEAYALLVKRYQDFAFTLALKYTHSREEAEELAQDAFVKAYRALADFRGASRFSTWLYTIVHTTCLSHLRLRKKPVVSVEPEKISQLEHRLHNPASASGGIEARHREQWIKTAIDALPETDQRIVSLFYQGEQSMEEIARILGMTAANVKIRLFRARQKMHTVLKQHLLHEARDLYLN